MQQIYENVVNFVINTVNKRIDESSIQLLSDLDSNDEDYMNIQAKTVNNKINAVEDIDNCRNAINAILTFEETKKNIGNYYATAREELNKPKNFIRYRNLIKAKNKAHLELLIKVGVDIVGSDGNFNWIDTSSITDMSDLFHQHMNFNGHIELWDVSNVTNMRGMFKLCSFNQPISNWDVSNVTNMHDMFECANSFNQPIGDWNVSNVKNMRGMFQHAKSFNQPIGNWDVSNVTNMRAMFYYAKSFNQPIEKWDVSSVTDMTCMFAGASMFNYPIGDWDVSSATDMEAMFFGARAFNQPIGNWDVHNVVSMSKMFQQAVSFNQPIGNWDVSKVTDTAMMFYYAKSFNQDISLWKLKVAKGLVINWMFGDCPIKEEYKPTGIE